MYEALTFDHPYANDRMHTFVLEGVPETARRARELGIGYCFYLRQTAAHANDVLYRLAADAATLVIDDYPSYLPAQFLRDVPQKVPCTCHAVEASTSRL